MGADDPRGRKRAAPRDVPTREIPARDVPTREMPVDAPSTREFGPVPTRELDTPPASPPPVRPAGARLVDAAKRQAADGLATVAQAARAAAPKPSSATEPKPPAHDPISKLLRAVNEVAYEALTILEHPRTFPVRLKLADESLFSHGTRFLLGTVPAMFLLLLPVHMIHGRPVTQTSVGVLFTIIAFTSGPMVYLALRLAGARATTVGAAVGMNCYMMGAQGLAMIVLSYPIALRYGSKVFFGTTPEESNALIARMGETDLLFFTGNLLLSYVVLTVWFVRGWIPAFATYFAIPRRAKTRTFFALMIPLVITSLLVQLFLPQLKQAADTL
jgi:hypothetical protein